MTEHKLTADGWCTIHSTADGPVHCTTPAPITRGHFDHDDGCVLDMSHHPSPCLPGALAPRERRRDIVALVVTVEVDAAAWEATYQRGPYDANDVADYVREQIEQSGAVRLSECMSPDVKVRFRRPPGS